MTTIFKTWKKATYFKGLFELRDLNKNWATPIEFPSVFVAYGQAIKSGNWQSYTNINTPEYVIKHYFDTIGNSKNHKMFTLWNICKDLERIKWSDVKENKDHVLNLIDSANKELLKLQTL